MEFLQNLLDGAWAVRWVIVIVAFAVLVAWLAEAIGDRNMAEDERDEAEAVVRQLGARNAELRAERDALLRAVDRQSRQNRRTAVAGRRTVTR